MGNSYSPTRSTGGPLGANHRFNGLPLEVVGQIGQAGTSGIQTVFDHFYSWKGPAGHVTAPAAGWFVEGSNNSESATALASTQFGVLQLSTGTVDNNFIQMRLAGEAFRYVSGKRLWCFARFAMSDADDMETYFGLSLTDTNFLDTLPTDGIFFEKAETATSFDFHARQNGTSTERTAIAGTLADDTYIELGFTVNPYGSIIPWYNGTALNASVVGASNANIPDDEDLTIILGCQTGAAAANTINLDWLLVGQER